MEPRLVTRTHYQVDEPAYLKLLTLRCTSPVRSAYAERVAARLVSEVRSKMDQKLNAAAAGYAVDLCRRLSLITNNLTWTEIGQLAYLVCSPVDETCELNLTVAEQLFFFRVLLEYDGCALVFLAKQARKHNQLPPPGRSWSDIANEMVLSVYSDYLDLVTHTADRTRLRQSIAKRRAHPYTGKSGPHQMFVHLQSMGRLGLLARQGQGSGRRYGVPDGESSALDALLANLPDTKSIEATVQQRNWPRIASSVFSAQLPSQSPAPLPSGEEIIREIKPSYDKLCSTGIALCSLRTLIEANQIARLIGGSGVLEYAHATRVLSEYQKTWPREVRFHVDRHGRPAFIKLSDSLKL